MDLPDTLGVRIRPKVIDPSILAKNPNRLNEKYYDITATVVMHPWRVSFWYMFFVFVLCIFLSFLMIPVQKYGYNLLEAHDEKLFREDKGENRQLEANWKKLSEKTYAKKERDR